MSPDRAPVSIVCVFNDARVRHECLDLSIQRLEGDALALDYVPVDNTHGTFATAGAALMHGVSSAKSDVVAFVHQDVVLHSIVALERAAAIVAEGQYRMLGAVGVTSDGRMFGRIRDRVVLLGEEARRPVEVDSLDEVLFMARRSTLEREPLCQDRELAWHAYAVEYGLRAQRDGSRVGALTMPLTHNSLTTNLDRLSEAHVHVAGLYPEAGDTNTTCGVIRSGGPQPKRFASQRWRHRWVQESLYAARLARRTGLSSIVLSDIRVDIDDLLRAAPDSLRIMNLDRGGTFDDGPLRPLVLRRYSATVKVQAMTLSEITEALQQIDDEQSILITDLNTTDLVALAPTAIHRPTLVGVHRDAGNWLLSGPCATVAVTSWSTPRAKPFAPVPMRRR
jgi:CRISPR/Cas system-associated endoribonuclease Cas2